MASAGDQQRPDVDGDTPPIDPAESLRLIAEQRARMARSIAPDPLLVYAPWGAAWLLSYGAFFLDRRALIPMPGWLPGTVLAVTLTAAAVIFWLASARAYRQIVGPSSTQGTMYGAVWFIAFGTMMPLVSRFAKYLPEEQVGLLFGATPVGLVAILYAAGAAVWRFKPLLWLGAWLATVNVIGVFAGADWHPLIISVAGGGAMLSVGVGLSLHRRRHC